MLYCNVVPGKQVGDFTIGDPLARGLKYARAEVKSIPCVELKYNEKEPLELDITLDLSKNGIRLHYEPCTQKLRVIEVYQARAMRLSYDEQTFSAPDLAATFEVIYNRFGPTHPGKYDPVSQCYELHYPGITFTFPIPTKYVNKYSSGRDMPLQFPDGTTPQISRMLLYYGVKGRATLPPAVETDLYFEPVSAIITKGLFFKQRNVFIGFDMTPQDLLSDLGEPDRVHEKLNDKMRIHSGLKPAPFPDYFYNYFDLGIDVLFNGTSHTVTKIVLHTNFPSHYDFHRYSKCNFTVYKPDAAYDPEPIRLADSGDENGEEPRPAAVEDAGAAERADDGNAGRGPELSEELVIIHDTAPVVVSVESAAGNASAALGEELRVCTADTKFAEVERVFGAAGSPVVHKVAAHQNPFGPTFYFGYKGVIFEVMEDQHIASLCLFKV